MYNVQQAGAVLTIDVGAIADNWRQLAKHVGKAECSAVVKTNAYGLGMTKIAPALSWAGCKTFFVTNVAEGIELRQCLGNQRVFVLHGNYSNTESDFLANDLIPVLNSLKQVSDWSNFAKKSGKTLPAALHIDTGMTRLGLSFSELNELLNTPDAFDGIELVMFMSHLACSDEKDNPKNSLQQTLFYDACKKIKKRWENIEFSLASSAGVFLGQEYIFDIVRTGIALYGCNPCLHQKNPMKPVVKLQGKILQLQDVDSSQTVGYGATYNVPTKGRIATVS
ncbi:MAG: alanine racemase, partial [Alphaproteobacteria bacterium]|nr:alanine racemase [Alphaproteobacteria bacterium]